MKRLLKSWVFWAFVVPPLLGGLAYGARRQTDVLYCACGSVKEAVFWRLGFPDGPSVPVFPESARETASPLFVELLGAAHAHAWYLSRFSGRSLRGPYGLACVLRVPPRNLAALYAQEPLFKAWLRDKAARGELGPEAVEAELAGNPLYPPGTFPFGWNPPR